MTDLTTPNLSKKTIQALKIGESFTFKSYDLEKTMPKVPRGYSWKTTHLNKNGDEVEHCHHGYYTRFTRTEMSPEMARLLR